MAKELKAILSEQQKKFLKIFGRENSLVKRFYLTGGTALAEFYLHHRYSEDLDFFNEEEFSLLPIRAFIKKAEKELEASKIDYQTFLGLHTFFFWFPNNDKLKVDFNYYPFPRIEKGLKSGEITIDSAYDIAVNKVHTISMQPRARDFIDIYFLIREKGYSMEDLLFKAKAKFDWHIDPIQLGAQFIKAGEAEDLPRMIKKIKTSAWRSFFIDEAKKLKGSII